MNSYHSIIVKGPAQDGIVAYLDGQKQDAFVSPTLDGLTFVYAPDEAWSAPAEDLSRAFGCPALFAWVHDADVFGYDLYDNGRHLDAYNSAPDYFEGEDWEGPDDAEDTGEATAAARPLDLPGGDARLLCAAFGAGSAAEQVDAILREPVEVPIHLREVEAFEGLVQHHMLAEAMGWPPDACVQVDYGDLEREGIGEELAAVFAGAPFVKTPTAGGA